MGVRNPDSITPTRRLHSCRGPRRHPSLLRRLGGVQPTPFADPTLDGGWEDDLDHPRSADELVGALQSTWSLIAGCLDRWTPAMLDETIVTESRRSFSRQSILLRLLSHDAYHAGELSQTLGIAGLPQVDLWPPEDHPL